MKAIYDKYGEYGLKEGVIGPDGKTMGGGYFMKCNSNEIYEKEFTSTNPWEYQDCFTENMHYGSMFAASVGGLEQKAESAPADIVMTLCCTLEEFYNGSLKQISFERNVMKDNARTTQKEKVNQSVEVKPGFSDGTELTFKGEGHQAEGCPTSNLVIKFKQECNNTYTRMGEHLMIKHKITLAEAIKGTPVNITTLDKRNITLMVDELISPQTCKEVVGEGMPCEGGRGNLYIKFDIQFPVQFSTDSRTQIVCALKANECELAETK